MLTISRLARWSIDYYNDTVHAAKNDTATVAGLSGWTPPRSPAGWRTPTSRRPG